MNNPSVTVITKLKAWSDIAFLQYKAEADVRGVPLENLRYIISANVQTPKSKAVLGRALAEKPD